MKTKFSFILILSIFFMCQANLNPTVDDLQLLKGSWVAEGSSFSERWHFGEDGTLTKFKLNNVESTYHWKIINEINSGTKSKYLELVNKKNANNIYNYEISILSENKLVLIYQRPNNMGISKPLIFKKQ